MNGTRQWPRMLVMALTVMALAATACGGSDEPDTTAAEPPGATEGPTGDDASPVGATADETEEPGEPAYQDGDTIRIVLGSSPGGGFDTHARLLQPYLESAISEASGANVRVLVENRTGSLHRVATEFVYNSPPDGTRLVFSVAQLLAANEALRGADTDIAKMVGIASPGRSVRGIVVRTDVDWPGDTMMDVLDYSASNTVRLADNQNVVEVALMKALLRDAGVEENMEPVSVGNTAETATALLRGDIEAAYADLAGILPFVEDNPEELEAITFLGCERSPLFPDVPTAIEQEVPGAEDWCHGALSGQDLIFLAAPGTPDNVASVLQEAMESALTNEEYLEKIRAATQPDEYYDAEYVSNIVADTVELYASYAGEIDLPDEEG